MKIINESNFIENLESEEYFAEDLTTTFKAKLAKAAEDKAVHTLDNINDLRTMLDKILLANIRQMRNLRPGETYRPLNILIIGDAGTGKSEIISDWLRKTEIKGQQLRKVKFNGSQLNPDIVQGVGHAVHKTDDETGETMDYADYLNFKVFDKLNPDPKDAYGAILFIDEINRSYSEARAALLDMITSHEIADNTKGENTKYLDNWIMTVAAMNPPDTAHKGAELLDIAMLTRFYIFEWKGSVKGARDAIISKIRNQMETAKENLEAGVDQKGRPYDEEDYKDDTRVFEGQMRIAKLIMNKDLVYDSGDTLKANQKKQKAVLNSRTVEETIRLCDGTPEDFLRLLPGTAGISTDSDAYKKMKLALTSATDTDTGLIKELSSAYDKLMDFEDNL